MSVELSCIVLDAENPRQLAAFWCQFLGASIVEEEEEFVTLETGRHGFRLGLVRSYDPKIVKNRMHLDLVVDDMTTEVDRALCLGARLIDIGQAVGSAHQKVLSDTDGNEFCLVTEEL